MTEKFEKIKLLYPIVLILAEIFSVCCGIFNDYDMSVMFVIALIMFMFSTIAEIIFMCRKTKSIGIISIIAAAISFPVSRVFLLFVIANFLYINNKNKIENEKALL